MILNDQQLRAFNIKNPCAEETAAELGPNAHASRLYGKAAPPIDYAPELSLEVRGALVSSHGIIPLEGSPFNFNTWENCRER